MLTPVSCSCTLPFVSFLMSQHYQPSRRDANPIGFVCPSKRSSLEATLWGT